MGLTLQQIDDELVGRGFDGIDQPFRFRYANWGYKTVARKSAFSWAHASQAVSVAAGTTYITLSQQASGGDINNYRDIEKVLIATDPYRNPLEAITDDEFHAAWLPIDLTAVANRGIPDGYYIYDNKIYLLPPPRQTLSILVYYHRQPGTLVNPSDVTITPDDLDEAIIEATLIKIHNRVGEFIQSDQARTDLSEIIDDTLSNEELIFGDEQERVEPDNSWL